MAKARTKKVASKSGKQELPFLSSAFICEKVLLENKVHSAIRMIDTLTLQKAPNEIAEYNDPKYDAIELPLTLFIGFRAGQARGDFDCQIIVRSPSGLQFKYGGIRFNLAAEAEDNTGAIGTMPIRLKWETSGIYWFEIWVNKKLLTKVPLKLVIAEQVPDQKGK